MRFPLLSLKIWIILFGIIGTNNTAYGNNDTSSNQEANQITIQDTKILSEKLDSFSKKFHLIASVPDENIYVYGLQPKGIIIYYQDNASFIDIDYITPRQILPKINYSDYNQDGKKEIALSFHNMSGTGVAIEELHILTVDTVKEQFLLTDYPLETETILNSIKDNLLFKYNNQNHTIQLQLQNQEYLCSIENRNKKFNHLNFGNIIEFDVTESSITVKVPIAAVYENEIEGDYFGTISSEIHFQNNQFTLHQMTFHNN